MANDVRQAGLRTKTPPDRQPPSKKRQHPTIPDMSITRYYALATYFRQRFGQRIQKIPLDAGGACPNRDGTLSTQGCAFCNQLGSGTGLARAGLSAPQQYLTLRDAQLRKRPGARFMAYIQSFSNTHGPAARLRSLISALADLPDLVGLAIGTRPDCLDEEKLTILADAPWTETWLDLGLQSAHDRTLFRIQRGHDSACFARWAERAAQTGLKVCAHVITGLPGETLADFEQTISFVNRLPVRGIKIHNLLICAGTPLERTWREGSVSLLTREESLSWLARGLALLRPDIVVHRLNADPSGDELVAPAWAADKRRFLDDARRLLEATNTWQGQALGRPLPAWFSPDAPEAP